MHVNVDVCIYYIAVCMYEYMYISVYILVDAYASASESNCVSYQFIFASNVS